MGRFPKASDEPLASDVACIVGIWCVWHVPRPELEYFLGTGGPSPLPPPYPLPALTLVCGGRLGLRVPTPGRCAEQIVFSPCTFFLHLTGIEPTLMSPSAAVAAG